MLTRELIGRESPSGGFTGIYPVLKAMEEAGRIRRGYFIDGLGASQFAVPGAEDRLRENRARHEEMPLLLAATDPANAFGAAIAWPAASNGGSLRPTRSAGARVILREGRLLAFLARGNGSLLCFAQPSEPERGEDLAAIASVLCDLARDEPLLLAEIDALPAAKTDLGNALMTAGFESGFKGMRLSARNRSLQQDDPNS